MDEMTNILAGTSVLLIMIILIVPAVIITLYLIGFIHLIKCSRRLSELQETTEKRLAETVLQLDEIRKNTEHEAKTLNNLIRSVNDE